jgi:anti-anti-sigma factor
MDITVRKENGILVCALAGEIDLYAAPDFHARYVTLSAQEPSCHFVFDLEKTSYIDSSGIGILFKIYSDTRNRKANFCICNANGMVKKLFFLSRMTQILPIEGDLSGAMARVRDNA